jgi:hypothetical protein
MSPLLPGITAVRSACHLVGKDDRGYGLAEHFEFSYGWLVGVREDKSA